MAEKSFDYKSCRAEARKRFILFTQKDGVKTLASKLRMHDRLMAEKESNTEEKVEYEETVDEEEASDLTFDQRLQLLQLERQIRIEEREAERKKRLNIYMQRNNNENINKRNFFCDKHFVEL